MPASRRTSRLRANLADDAIHDLLEFEIVRVDDDRILRRSQRRDRAFRVDAVAQLHLLAHGLRIDAFAAALILRRAPADLLVQAGDQEELVLRPGKRDRAEFATRR